MVDSAQVVTGDLAYDVNREGALTMSPGGRLRVDASGSASAPPLPAGTDRSGAITTGGTAQQLAPANVNRLSLTGQNISAGDLWINEIGGTAAVDTAGSYKIPAGTGFAVSTNRAVSIIGATTGQKFSATEA